MKKFVLFQYEGYYPTGGLGDVTGSFDTLEEAKEAVTKKRKDTNEVVDRDTWEIVWSDE